MRTFYKQTKAFTMIELVFVIVVLGSLAALALPRMDRDLRQEAADNVLSAIRYTQHLALVDDKTNPFDTVWQQTLWQMRFSESTSPYALHYTISSNMNHQTNLNQSESAIDPANGKYMHSTNDIIDSDESPNIFLTKKYGITSMTFNDCHGSQNTTAKHIAFDHLGRPHRGVTQGASNDYRTYVSNKNCQITFDSPSFDPFTIIIEKETGYAYID
jgi:prepilin-type N-terminal cleavage/methylation domain-containing protein